MSPEALLRLFEAALDAVWVRTKTTLGEVTLTAIAERVLHNASEKFSLLGSLKVEPKTGILCRELNDRIGSLDPSELRAAIRFVLVEMLTVLGNLTAEILTPGLQAAISAIAPPGAVLAGRRLSPQSVDAANAEDREKKSWRK